VERIQIRSEKWGHLGPKHHDLISVPLEKYLDFLMNLADVIEVTHFKTKAKVNCRSIGLRVQEQKKPPEAVP
jgi:hypothetical protein